MLEPFPHHRDAALALLNACPALTIKAAGFLGHVCVTATITERQRDWLVKLLAKHAMPGLAEEGAR